MTVVKVQFNIKRIIDLLNSNSKSILLVQRVKFWPRIRQVFRYESEQIFDWKLSANVSCLHGRVDNPIVLINRRDRPTRYLPEQP